MGDKDQTIFLRHMLESIKDIKEFMGGVSKEKFEENKEKLNAVVRSVEILGEAAKKLSESFKNKHKEIPWKEIIGTRDILIHHYFGVDMDILWNIITKDLLDLEKQIKDLM